MGTLLLVIDTLKDSLNTLEVGASLITKPEMKVVLVQGKRHDKTNQASTQEDFESAFIELIAHDTKERTKIALIELDEFNMAELREVATKVKASLIIIGQEFKDTFSDMFLCHDKWLNQKNPATSILFLKKNYKFLRPSSILFACDFKPESISAFNQILALSDLWESNLKLLYVTLPGSQFLSSKDIDARVFKFLVEAGIKKPLLYLKELGHYADYSLEEGILSYADIISADLITMPTHGYSGLSRTGTCSIGEDVVVNSKRPVLTVRI